MQPSIFFPNARHFTISGGSFNSVQGDQLNHNTTVYNVRGNQYNQIIQQEKIEHTEFDEVRLSVHVCEVHLAESLCLHLVPDPEAW